VASYSPSTTSRLLTGARRWPTPPPSPELFLDDANTYGCAEVTLIVLQEQFGLPEAGDSSPAMALNGGIGYSGALRGHHRRPLAAAPAGRCLNDHAEAKGEPRLCPGSDGRLRR